MEPADRIELREAPRRKRAKQRPLVEASAITRDYFATPPPEVHPGQLALVGGPQFGWALPCDPVK